MQLQVPWWFNETSDFTATCKQLFYYFTNALQMHNASLIPEMGQHNT